MVSIVVDTSAIIACLTGEPERPEFMRILALAHRRVLSSVNLLEALLVVTGAKGLPRDWLDDFISNEGSTSSLLSKRTPTSPSKPMLATARAGTRRA